MAKKRPSIASRGRSKPSRPVRARVDAKYWRDRLFRNTFTHQGKRFEVNHWSVKIQHLGTRKTFSLRADNPTQAATEACQLYKTILSRGWERVSKDGNGKPAGPQPAPAPVAADGEDGFDSEYWAERLVHRKYSEELHALAAREFSVRLHHEGASYYFPLRTDNRKLAAGRAMGI